MLRIEVDNLGDPGVLVPRDGPDPVAGPGEVVVDVSVADVLHLDTVIRRGATRGILTADVWEYLRRTFAADFPA